MRRVERALIGALGAALAVSLIGAASAGATFHLIKVREVFPGTVAQPDSDYVELQMYSPFQNQVQFGQLGVYNANGTSASTFMPSSMVGSGDDQRTVLIGDSTFGTVFTPLSADFTDGALNLSPAAGAVCWPINSTPIDCVSWGAFTGNASLPSSAGSPIQGGGASGAIADGKAITRSITAGCPTALEDADDTNNSAGDFTEGNPAPRPNPSVILETLCAPPPGGTPPASPPVKKKKKKCKKHKRSAAVAKKCKKKRK